MDKTLKTFLSDGYMSLENIKDMILPPPDANETFGNYEGWANGNPLTGN